MVYIHNISEGLKYSEVFSELQVWVNLVSFVFHIVLRIVYW